MKENKLTRERPAPAGSRQKMTSMAPPKFTLSVWEEWRKLTEFFALSDHVYASQANAWNCLPLADSHGAQLRIGSGDFKFESTGDRYATVLGDRHMLSTVVLIHSYGLLQVAMFEAYEELSKIAHANTPLRSSFIADNKLIETLMSDGGIETWGDRILNDLGRSWNDVEGGKAGIVEAATIRNAVAHGQRTVSQKMENRVMRVGGTLPWKVGNTIRLDIACTKEYRHRFRSFMRVVDHGVYQLA
ncbi:hypothetical protein ACI2TX_17380 [Ralstonia nicotianae]